MGAKEMEAKIKSLEKRVRNLEDIEEIQRLQKSYGYYLEHWMSGELIDLFSDGPDVVFNIASGIYLGKPGVRKYFEGLQDFSLNPEFLHQSMQLSGIVDIGPGGKTAQGRWYALGAVALPAGQGVRAIALDGIYTAEYIREDGKWKINKLKFNPIFMVRPDEGWVKKERIAAITPGQRSSVAKPDKPRDVNTSYPSGYIVPFHFKHPVTGKKSGEAKRNASLKRQEKPSP
jgi:hypothetical protein